MVNGLLFHSKKGFTLIEVLVALTILSISLLAIFTALSASITHIAYLKNKSAGEWIALNIIAKTEGGFIPLNVNHTHALGKSHFFRHNWFWQATIFPSIYSNVFIIKVMVSDENKNLITNLIGYINSDYIQ